MVVFEGLVPEGEAPTIRATPIPFGGAPGVATLVAMAEGQPWFAECGCCTCRAMMLASLPRSFWVPASRVR